MCNINNIEQIRQKFWCDVALLHLKESRMPKISETTEYADLMTAEFDKRFNSQLKTKETDRVPPIVNTSFPEPIKHEDYPDIERYKDTTGRL